MKTINDFNFSGKRALIRVDFNVPLNKNFEVTDDNRIRATIPTLKKILRRWWQLHLNVALRKT
jgi:phosphoglycerate kinase